MLSVYTNVASNIGRLNSIRAQAGQLRSMENLSSGQRINNSADDAVGLAVSNKILKTIKGLNASLKNISDGISLTQIAQNSASEISDMIIRIRELAIQNHNGTYSENDRLNSQHEVDALLKQIDQIADNTSFNSKNLIDGSYLETLRTGNLNTEQTSLNFDRLGTDTLGGGRILTKHSALNNLSPTYDFQNKTRISAVETEKLTLNTSILSLDFQNFITSSPNGKFEISGPNSDIFSVNQETGTIVSNNQIFYKKNNEIENRYKINLSYETPSGLIKTELIRIRIEELTPKLLEIKTAQTDLSSQEAENVKIQALDFPTNSNNSVLSAALRNYIGAHPDGTFSLEGNDAANFSLNAQGEIIGNLNYNAPQDSDQNNIYDLSLKYQRPNGDSFLENISLTIQSSVPPSSLGAHNVLTEEIITGSNLDLNAIVTKENLPGIFDPQMTTIDLDNGSLTFGAFFQNFSTVYGTGGNFSIRNISYNGPNVFDPLIHNISIEAGNILTLGGPNLSDAIPFGDYFGELVYSSGGEEFVYDLQLFADPGNGPSVSIFSSDTMPSKSVSSFQNITIGNDDLTFSILENPATRFSMINQIANFAPGGTLNLNNITIPAGGDANHLRIQNNQIVISSDIVTGQYTADVTYSVGANSVTTSVNFSIVGKPPRPCINNASKLAPSAQGIPTDLFREHNGNFVESYLARTSSIFEATEAKKLSFSIFDIPSVTSEELVAFVTANPDGVLTLEGPDASMFSINQLGDIKLNSIADFEKKTSYDFRIKYQQGENNFQNNVFIEIIDDFTDNTLHLENVNISSAKGAKQAVLIATKALEQVSSFSAYAGASQNRLNHSLELTYEKLSTTKISRGRIVDSDFAQETTILASKQLILQSSQGIIAQANTAKQNLLALLE